MTQYRQWRSPPSKPCSNNKLAPLTVKVTEQRSERFADLLAALPGGRRWFVDRPSSIRGRRYRPAAPLGFERTFFWFGLNRRLAKDFETLPETLATFVTFASIQLPLR